MPFLIFNVFLLFDVHNCRNEVSLKPIFLKHFLICNPKLCINQAIKVTKSDFFDFRMFLLLFVVHNCRNEEKNVTNSDFYINISLFVIQNFVLIKQ